MLDDSIVPVSPRTNGCPEMPGAAHGVAPELRRALFGLEALLRLHLMT
jgi:hypothetical protein